MNLAVVIVALIAAVVTVVSMLLLFWRLRGLPKAKRLENQPLISVIIPARDEEANLQRLLPSLRAQTCPALEVIVVDDQSSDRTAEVVEENGYQVIHGKALPEGWFGKPWACHQGAQAAKGYFFLFLDSDLTLDRDAIARLGMAANCHQGAIISVCPWHRVERLYEQFSVFFNVLMLGGIGAFTWKGSRAKGIGLFGQVMLLSRVTYEKVGGHEAVKKTVLENFELSRICHAQGVPCECYSGQGSVFMRMFPRGFKELMNSWLKGFSRGASLAPPLALFLSSLWITGLMTLAVCLFLSPLTEHYTWFFTIYGLVVVTQFFLFRKVGSFSAITALIFPVPLLFYQGLFATSLLRKKRKSKTEWKGRHVD